jgi:hypothetical protein
MRNKKVAFLSCAVVAAAGLLATPAAMATGSCPAWSVSYEGPCAVNSTTPSTCLPAGTEGKYTAIKYNINKISGYGNASNVATLVTANNLGNVFVAPASGVCVSAPCVGDTPTSLGKNSCHELAVRVNPNASTSSFWVIVAGRKAAIQTSIAVKSGNCVKAYAVPGLGLDTNPFQAVQKKETVNFKGCSVDFVYDAVTGAVVSASLAPPPASTKPPCPLGQNDGTCCAFNGGDDVSGLRLILNDRDLGAGQFGDGYISSGENSCTTRVIGGRVYTWGSPCPD